MVETRLDSTCHSLDRMESRMDSLVDSREAPKKSSPGTPLSFSKNVPSRVVSTPADSSRDMRVSSSPNNAITMESAYQMSEMISQTVAERPAENMGESLEKLG